MKRRKVYTNPKTGAKWEIRISKTNGKRYKKYLPRKINGVRGGVSRPKGPINLLEIQSNRIHINVPTSLPTNYNKVETNVREKLGIQQANLIIEKLRQDGKNVICITPSGVHGGDKKETPDMIGGDGFIFSINVDGQNMIIKTGNVSEEELNITRNKILMKKKIIPKTYFVYEFVMSSKPINNTYRKYIPWSRFAYVQEFIEDSFFTKKTQITLENLRLLIKKSLEFQLISGYYHGDLNYTNLMAIREGRKIIDFRLIDYGRAKPHGHLPLLKKYLELEGLLEPNNTISLTVLEMKIQNKRDYVEFSEELRMLGNMKRNYKINVKSNMHYLNHGKGRYYQVCNTPSLNNLEALNKISHQLQTTI